MAIEIELNGNSIQFTLLNQVELIISSYTFEHLSCYDANIALNTSATDDLSWKAQLGRSKESETKETEPEPQLWPPKIFSAVSLLR